MSAVLASAARPHRPDPREGLLLQSLFNASRGFRHRLRPELERENLTSPMFWALHQLVQDGPMAVGRIASLCVVTPANVSAAVERLVEAGLVARASSPKDRRVVLIRPTARGRSVHREVWSRMARVLVRSLEGVPSADLATTADVLRRLAASSGPGASLELEVGR
jgi:DNA-binding MarR family transcriptional regulator